MPLTELTLNDANDVCGAEGVEVVHECNTDVYLGGL